eukprot:196463-Chlamydomonas_euryale.AAC.3
MDFFVGVEQAMCMCPGTRVWTSKVWRARWDERLGTDMYELARPHALALFVPWSASSHIASMHCHAPMPLHATRPT